MTTGAAMEIIDVSKLLKRNLTWDVLPCPMVPEFLPRIGLMPGSEDGNQLEHVQSHRRLAEIRPILPTVTTFATMAGDSAARAILESQGHDVIDDDDPTLKHYINLVTTCSAAVIANLIASNVIHISEDIL